MKLFKILKKAKDQVEDKNKDFCLRAPEKSPIWKILKNYIK